MKGKQKKSEERETREEKGNTTMRIRLKEIGNGEQGHGWPVSGNSLAEK